PVLQAHARGALDLDHQRVVLVFDPADLEMLAVERAVENLAAIVIGHELAAALAPQRLPPVGKAGAGAARRRHEIGRTAIDRDLEDGRRKPRPVAHRLVVAGEEAGTVAQLADAQRAEVALEKLPRPLLAEPSGGERPAAHLLERGVHRAVLALRGSRAGQR